MKSSTENGENKISKAPILYSGILTIGKSKGAIEEIVWIVTIIAAILTISIFLFAQQSSEIDIKRQIEERLLDEEGISFLLSFGSNRPPHLEKYYAEILVDSLLHGVHSGERNDTVFYGNGIGKIRMYEIVPFVVEQFTNRDWKLTVVTPDGTHFYGKSGQKNVQFVYEIAVPVPEERIGKIIFEIY